MLSDSDVSEDYDNDPLYQAMSTDIDITDEDQKQALDGVEEEEDEATALEKRKLGLQRYINFEMNLTNGSFVQFVLEEDTKRE